MDYVITLVHGTWGDTTGWVAPGSFLRRELERRLTHVTFRVFPWTGTNTHAARTEAGVRLAAFIRDGHAQHPHAQHVIVAHSHGGNVALYAMRDPAAREVVNGIVTLGTPFISARVRDPHRHADAIAWLTLGVAALAAFVVLDAVGLARLAAAWLVGAVVLIVKMKPALSRWVTDTATREQADIVAALEPPGIDPQKLMVLCARRDEARGWLRTWDVAARAPFAIGCVLLSLVQGASRANLPGFVNGLTQSTLHRGLDELQILGVDGWTLMVGVIVLCVIWAVVLMWSGLVRWPGYWREPLLANLLVEIGTDSVPRATDGTCHAAYTFGVPQPRVRHRETHGYLRHTAISEDAAVVSAIADWIGDGLHPHRATYVDAALLQRVAPGGASPLRPAGASE